MRTRLLTSDHQRCGSSSGLPSEQLETPAPRHLHDVDVTCMCRLQIAVPPHAFDWLSISLVLSPMIVRRESCEPIEIVPGTIIVAPPLEVIAMRSTGHGICRVRTLLIGSTRRRDLATAIRPAVLTDSILSRMLAELLVRLDRPIISTSVVTRLDGFLERALANETLAETPGLRHATPLKPVREYLRRHLSAASSVQDLERYSGLTRYHLARRFRREFGLPPRAYQLRQRLARALRLLAQGAHGSDVAYECGFADQSHLTRSFKVAYGITPHRWSAAFQSPKAAIGPSAQFGLRDAFPRVGNDMPLGAA
jgi:AraC-like DNA-binding protein